MNDEFTFTLDLRIEDFVFILPKFVFPAARQLVNESSGSLTHREPVTDHLVSEPTRPVEPDADESLRVPKGIVLGTLVIHRMADLETIQSHRHIEFGRLKQRLSDFSGQFVNIDGSEN